MTISADTRGTPSVELLYWPDCPSHGRALQELKEALSELGLNDEVIVRAIETDEDAVREKFVGSPTIRLNHEDIVDPGDDPVALGCRVYRRLGGGFTPVPDPEYLREALRRAFAIEQENGS